MKYTEQTRSHVRPLQHWKTSKSSRKCFFIFKYLHQQLRSMPTFLHKDFHLCLLFWCNFICMSYDRLISITVAHLIIFILYIQYAWILFWEWAATCPIHLCARARILTQPPPASCPLLVCDVTVARALHLCLINTNTQTLLHTLHNTLSEVLHNYLKLHFLNLFFGFFSAIDLNNELDGFP